MAHVKQRKKPPTRRGRPPGGRYGAVFQLRLSADTEAAVSKWAAKQGITRVGSDASTCRTRPQNKRLAADVL
jgi:hypothetical protein